MHLRAFIAQRQIVELVDFELQDDIVIVASKGEKTTYEYDGKGHPEEAVLWTRVSFR